MVNAIAHPRVAAAIAINTRNGAERSRMTFIRPSVRCAPVFARALRFLKWERYPTYLSSLSARIFDLVARGVVGQIERARRANDGVDRFSYALRALFAAVTAFSLFALPFAAALVGDDIASHGVWFAVGALAWLVLSEAQEARVRMSRYLGREQEAVLDARVFFGLFLLEVMIYIGVRSGMLNSFDSRTRVLILGVAFGAVADGLNTLLTIAMARFPTIASWLGLGPDDVATAPRTADV